LAEELPLHGIRTILAATKKVRTQRARFIRVPKWALFSNRWHDAEQPWSEACADVVAAVKTEIQFVIVSDAMLRVAVKLKRIRGVPFCLLNTTYHYFSNSTDLSIETSSYFAGRASLVENASLILHASDPHFEGRPIADSPKHRWIGPIFWEPTDFAPTCLRQSGDSWVLVSLSLAPLVDDESIAQTVNKALNKIAVRAIWTARARIRNSNCAVRLQRFASHSKILPHVRICVCHAGHGTVMKAMAHGVPMVLIPAGRDQFGVAKRAEACGVAVVVPRKSLTVIAARRAIEEVLSNPKYGRNAGKWAERLRDTDAAKVAAFHLRQLANAA
jgi:UDP:flavonoid glycosyltransferase YjiC (YdhE family)